MKDHPQSEGSDPGLLEMQRSAMRKVDDGWKLDQPDSSNWISAADMKKERARKKYKIKKDAMALFAAADKNQEEYKSNDPLLMSSSAFQESSLFD